MLKAGVHVHVDLHVLSSASPSTQGNVGNVDTCIVTFTVMPLGQMFQIRPLQGFELVYYMYIEYQILT